MKLSSFRKAILTQLFSIGIYSLQAQTDTHIFQVPEALSEQQLISWKKTLPKDGWFILQFKDQGYRLFNYSNKDYEMSMWLNCKENGKPGYLIEYSENYGDGNFGGIDYINSNTDNGNRIQFLLDGRDYGYPFSKPKSQIGSFKDALKKAQKLTISVYNKELNPQTGKDEERLNRSIEFKLANSELLDKPINCTNN
jgi:hypothetical protein